MEWPYARQHGLTTGLTLKLSRHLRKRCMQAARISPGRLFSCAKLRGTLMLCSGQPQRGAPQNLCGCSAAGNIYRGAACGTTSRCLHGVARAQSFRIIAYALVVINRPEMGHPQSSESTARQKEAAAQAAAWGLRAWPCRQRALSPARTSPLPAPPPAPPSAA